MKIKNLTNHHLKSLVVLLWKFSYVLPWLDDMISYPITDCLLKRLQRIQFVEASFVCGRYVNSIDTILRLGLLPIKERKQ